MIIILYSELVSLSILCTENEMKKATSGKAPTREPVRAPSARGRPRTNPTSIHLTLLPNQLARLDAWITDQDDTPSRAEGVRRVLDEALPPFKEKGRRAPPPAPPKDEKR